MPEDAATASSQTRVAESSFGRTLAHIAVDALLTLALLLALSVVHLALDYTAASREFKSLFSRIHEYVFLGTYLLLAVKGLVRIMRS